MNGSLISISSGGFTNTNPGTSGAGSITGFRPLNLRTTDVLLLPSGTLYSHWNVQESIAVNFPDPNSIVQQSWNTAWPEVLKFGGACVGILLAAYIIRSFRNQ